MPELLIFQTMPEVIITPPAVQAEAPAKRAAREILQRMSSAAADLLASHQEMYRRLWYSTDATPAEILAEIGTRGGEVFLRGGDVVGFLLGAGTGRPVASMETNEYTPPVAYTIHSDGTVTLD